MGFLASCSVPEVVLRNVAAPATLRRRALAKPMRFLPQYPIYIISKGRWSTRLTSRALEAMDVPYRIVVEPQEYEQYASVIAPHKILRLPFSDLGQGSIPARNWVWEHSIAEGFDRHWILDDNIEAFNRLNRNIKPEVDSGAMFRAAEDFVNRYENVPLSGFNYYSFCKSTEALPPYYLNTRIYSCILIDNKLPLRWRGRYNEDTDLSLRVLKMGKCTVLFNAFLCGKVCTMRMKGGNTDELYQGDGRKKMAESLAEQHPDCVKVVWRFKRWHHHVDYKAFKQTKLVRRQGIEPEDRVNNYGMVLVEWRKGKPTGRPMELIAEQAVPQTELFPIARNNNGWQEEWKDMPEFVQHKQREYAKLVIRFRNQADLDDFAEKIGQKLNRNSQCTWHPELVRDTSTTRRYVDQENLPNLTEETI